MFGLFKNKETAAGRSQSTGSIEDITAHVRRMGYDILPYGVAVALVDLNSGYNSVEAASHVAHATLARDVRDAGANLLRLVAFAPHARALIDVLTQYKDSGQMRPTLWRNDCAAILGVVTVDSSQMQWLEKVLSDPVVGAERLATSRIKYKVPNLEDDDGSNV